MQGPVKEEVACSVDAGVTGLLMKGTLIGKSFAFSRYWLFLGGAVPPKSARSQDV